MFDAELIEYTGTTLDYHTGYDLTVSVYKLGGGEIGEQYTGLWGYQVCDYEGTVLIEGEDLRTGMPHSHARAARVAADFAMVGE